MAQRNPPQQRQPQPDGQKQVIIEQQAGAGTTSVDGVDIPVNKTPNGEGVFPDNLDPAARPGDVFLLRPSNRAFVVTGMTTQPGVKALDSGLAINANTTSDKQEMTEIKQDNGWLAQLRLIEPQSVIPSGVEITFDFGGEQSQTYTTNNALGFATTDTVNLFDRLVEFYIHEQEELFLTFENTTGSQVTVGDDLIWAGYQYNVTEIDALPDGVAPVVVPEEALG